MVKVIEVNFSWGSKKSNRAKLEKIVRAQDSSGQPRGCPDIKGIYRGPDI